MRLNSKQCYDETKLDCTHCAQLSKIELCGITALFGEQISKFHKTYGCIAT